MLRYVMSDEARHVAFGVLSLQEYYRELTDAEMRERQEFAFEVAQRLQRRFAHSEMWERMGVDPTLSTRTMDQVNPPAQQVFQNLLFSKIVPNCKKLGLLDASGGWLRDRFTESVSSSSRTGSTPARSTPRWTRSQRTVKTPLRERRRPTAGRHQSRPPSR